MKEFLPVSEEELLEVNGRGGSSSSSKSSSSSSSKSSSAPASSLFAPKPSPAPAPPPKAVPAPQVLSSVEKGRVDAAVTARELANAKTLVAAKIPYDTNGSNNVVGKVNSLKASSADCSGTMSSVSGNPYQTTAALMNPATQSANGYVNAVTNKQAGTWTVVQYKDPKTGTIEGHTQMTMGDGKYLDSVDAKNRQGPSLTQTSTLDYLKNKGIEPISVTFLRPKN